MSTASGLATARVSAEAVKESVDVKPLFDDLRTSFATHKTYPYEWRIGQLCQMEKMLAESCDEIIAAVHADLRRPPSQSLLADVSSVLVEVRFAMRHLHEWMEPTVRPTPLTLKPAISRIDKQPKGVALIIGAWNFPFHVTFIPLVGAIASGCCVLLKPSEISANAASLIGKLVTKYLDTSCIKVVQGGIPETTALINLPFDHIFYTGNGAVAKVVLAAAAKNLTPVTLELGGKSPVYIDESANLQIAARRILDGKFFNAGQTCVAPDYILCNKKVLEPFLQLATKTIDAMFEGKPETSASFGRIINERHWERVSKLIETSDAKVVTGGLKSAKKEDRYIPPTILLNVSPSSALMHEETFGPVLSILPVESATEAIRFINSKERPLALYIFSESKAVTDDVLMRTHSGGVCVNDTIMHVANPELPFGGTGPSGMGAHHGKASFDDFSHSRAVMIRGTWLDPGSRYPPYRAKDLSLLKKLLIGPLVPKSVKAIIKCVFAIVTAFVAHHIFAKSRK